MLILDHKKLHVWQKSIEVVSEVYSMTKEFPSAEKFSLVSQLRRAAVSIPSNISEGASRKSVKERKRFYEIARSSLVELDTQIEIAISLRYVAVNDLKRLQKLANEIFAMLSAMT